MTDWYRNPLLKSELLPVDIVLHPSWWYRREGITFDSDFFFHPARRVEVEQQMERALYERWGRWGVGERQSEALPQVGAVHLAAGYLLSEMLGCEVRYEENASPTVLPGNRERLDVDVDAAFASPAWRKFNVLRDALREKYGYLAGDVNWSGILNLALDVRGQDIFIDMIEKPDEVQRFFAQLATVIEKFTDGIVAETKTSSISVNRNVRHLERPVFLHSECTHTMISNEDYNRLLFQFDKAWSEKYRPYGIHFCGVDPHRFAEDFAKLPALDFLDVGWGGDVAVLRKHLPKTFLNIRLSPVDIVDQGVEEIRADIRRLVEESENPYLTGVCCINMDDQVDDAKVDAIFTTVSDLREEYRADAPAN